MESICEIVRKAESNYTQGNTTIGKYVNWSMHDTIERIDAYLNSQHISGPVDSLGREKPFFNIVTAAVNIWYRATDLDRKDIKFIPTQSSTIILAFVGNVFLQNWMNENRFGLFLNQWGRALARYGSAVVKFVEKDGKLVPSVIPWNRLIVDSVDFEALPRIEKFYKTPAQLRQMPEYDQDVVDDLINALQSRKTIDKAKKDVQNEFIELYEVHGEMDSRLLDEKPNLSLKSKDIKYRQQMHVVSFTQGPKKQDGYRDFTLFRGKEAKDPYLLTHLIEEDGRSLGIGAVEYLFDAQWMQNHTVKNMKDTLDVASKLIFQTADTNFGNRNVLTAIETGDVMNHAEGKPLERIANDKPDIQALQNYGMMWQRMGQELTATPEAMRGQTPTSGTPYATTSLLTAQSNSLFEIMTESKGLHMEDMMRTFVIPHLKKQLKHSDEVVAVLDDAGVTEIDSIYIPHQAIKNYNNKAKDQILSGQIPPPFNQQQEQQGVQQQLGSQGNKRFFTPDELGQTQWDAIFSDFEWDSIRVEVTNEQSDKAMILQTLNTTLQTIATNPMVLQDPNAKMIFSAILAETGKISPIQFSTANMLPRPPMTTLREMINFADLPPDGKQQLAAKAGLQIQPPPPIPTTPTAQEPSALTSNQ